MEEKEISISNHHKKEEKKTLAEVIIAQIDLCRKEFSKEMRAGFNQKIWMENSWIVVSVPDQREVVQSCTKTLYDLLETFFDNDFNEYYKDFNKNKNALTEVYFEQYLSEETNHNLKSHAKKTGKIPMTEQSNLSETIRQRHLNGIAESYRKLFRKLVLLFKRKNELSGKRMLGYK